MDEFKFNSSETAWNTGVFDVFADPEIFVQGALCPFYVSAKTKAGVEGRRMTCVDMICCPSAYFTRLQMRQRYRLGSSDASDCLEATFLWQCVLCQHLRELKIKRDLMLCSYKPATLEMR